MWSIKLIRPVLFFSVLILFFSCEEDVVLNPNKERLVNVFCVLTNDTVQYVNLSYTQYYDEYYDDFVDVKDADISVTAICEGVTKVHKFEKAEDGIWVSNFVPEQGVKYSLDVKIGDDVFCAETIFPVMSEQDISYMLAYNDYFLESTPESRIWRYSVDLGSTDFAALWFHGVDFCDKSGLYTPVSMMYSDSPYCDKFSISNISLGSLDEFAYPGWLQLPLTPELMFKHDFVNGAGKIKKPLLCFARVNGGEDRNSDLVYNDCIRMSGMISDAIVGINGDGFFTVVGSFKPLLNGMAHKNSYILMQCVSSEYDNYLKDVTISNLKLKEDHGELGGLFGYDEVFSNIRSISGELVGMGVFGASIGFKFPVS